jgi:para-aminobenzoate synthetase component 1
VIVTELTPAPDPVRCCELLEGLSYRIFLDSALKGTLGTSLARYSFLTADPVAVVRSKGAATERLDLLNGSAHAVAGDALAAVQSTIAPYRTEPAPGLPPFQGGAAGYLAYDWANQLERLPTPRFDDLAMPDVVMGIYDWVIAWDHDQSRAWLISTGLPETSATARERRASERAAAVRERLADIEGGPNRAALRSAALCRAALSGP